MGNDILHVRMQAPAAGRINGAAAIPTAAAAGSEAKNTMDPVQRECWSIYNNPDALAGETGISVDEVEFPVSCIMSMCI